jgi:hypothetical protein
MGWCRLLMHDAGMIYGYVRVSTAERTRAVLP